MDRNQPAKVEGVKDLIDEKDVVLGNNSTGVTSLVGDGGIVDVEGEMEGELAGDVVSEGALIYEGGKVGVGAAVGWCGDGLVVVIGDYSGDGRRWDEGRGGCSARRAGGSDVVEAGVDVGLPLGEGDVEIDVAVNAFGDTDATECGEFAIKVLAEFAEVLVAGITEREDGIGEVSAARKVFETELLVERPDGIRRVPFAIGAGDKDRIALSEKCGGGVALKGDERGNVTLRFEVFGNFARETFCGARLRGVEYGYFEGRRRVRDGADGAWRGGVEAGKKSVEPTTLLGRERRVIGDIRGHLHD